MEVLRSQQMPRIPVVVNKQRHRLEASAAIDDRHGDDRKPVVSASLCLYDDAQPVFVTLCLEREKVAGLDVYHFSWNERTMSVHAASKTLSPWSGLNAMPHVTLYAVPFSSTATMTIPMFDARIAK